MIKGKCFGERNYSRQDACVSVHISAAPHPFLIFPLPPLVHDKAFFFFSDAILRGGNFDLTHFPWKSKGRKD